MLGAVAVRAHFWAATAIKGTLTVTGAWNGTSSTASTMLLLQPGESNVTLSIVAEASSIQLWWPVGMGAHPLYNVTATFMPAYAGPSPTSSRRIGFRFAALVTGNDTAPGEGTWRQSALG